MKMINNIRRFKASKVMILGLAIALIFDSPYVYATEAEPVTEVIESEIETGTVDVNTDKNVSEDTEITNDEMNDATEIEAVDEVNEVNDVTEIEAVTESEIEAIETESYDVSAQEKNELVVLDLTKENLSNSANYRYGWYKSWGGRFESRSATSMICTTNYYNMPDDTYYIHISDSLMEINIAEYDADGKWLKHTDKLYDGSTFTKQENTAYIGITMFSTKWGKKPLKLLDEGMEVDIESANFDEPIVEEIDEYALTKEKLSNPNNYQYGWYKSWGGEYAEASSSICSIDYYSVPDDIYYVYVNDSTVSLAISEYDSDQKWIGHTSNITDGSIFTKKAKTAYIKITLSSSKWGNDLYELLDYGLEIDISNVQKENLTNVNTIDISEADFADVNNWKAGAYYSKTGGYAINMSKICFNSFCYVGDGEYIVNLPAGYLKANIIELDDSGNVIRSGDYHGGQKWSKGDGTSKIAITIFTYGKNTSYTYEEYIELIKGYSSIGIAVYNDTYTPDGSMGELTAHEFVSKMNVGWSLGNSFDSKGEAEKRGQDDNLKQELNWGNPYVTKDLIDYVASCGFNTIRIPVTWYYNTYNDESGNLRVRQEWLERVQMVVDYAMADGLYVIINTHHDQPILYAGTSDKNMNQVLSDAANLWTDIAEYFKDYDEHLIFESYNEIDNVEKSWNYSDTSVAQMNQMNQVFVDTVRATGGNNANRILMIPTLLDSPNAEYMNAFVVPTDTATDRLVLQVHYYSKVFNQDLEGLFSQIESYSNEFNMPVVIGEFGTRKSYPISSLRAIQASNYVARAAEHGIKCIWWDNGSDYSIIDRRNFANSRTDIISALMEGANGIAYIVNDELEFNDISMFVRKMPNLSTGAIEEKYWGTLTTDLNGEGIPVQGGSYVMVNLATTSDAGDIWLQRIVFYDAEGNYISGKELQTWSYICQIPDNAAYMRVSFNSPTRTLSFVQYAEYLSSGKLLLGISLPNDNNIEAVQLTVK